MNVFAPDLAYLFKIDSYWQTHYNCTNNHCCCFFFQFLNFTHHLNNKTHKNLPERRKTLQTHTTHQTCCPLCQMNPNFDVRIRSAIHPTKGHSVVQKFCSNAGETFPICAPTAQANKQHIVGSTHSSPLLRFSDHQSSAPCIWVEHFHQKLFTVHHHGCGKCVLGNVFLFSYFFYFFLFFLHRRG